jgi:hypothetical protein
MKYRGSDALTARQELDSERRSFLKNAFAVGGGAGATLDAGGTVVSSASAEDGTSAGRPITAGRRRQRAWVGVNFVRGAKPVAFRSIGLGSSGFLVAVWWAVASTAEHVLGAMVDLAHKEVLPFLALLAFGNVLNRTTEAYELAVGPGTLKTSKSKYLAPANVSIPP